MIYVVEPRRRPRPAGTRYRLVGADRLRFRRYERARRRVFQLPRHICQGLTADQIAARYGLDLADVQMALYAARIDARVRR